MIWGTGTGRCGTRSLAKLLNGLHEPQPWVKGEAVSYYHNSSRTNYFAMEEIVYGRMMMNTNAVVDFTNTYVMDLIAEVDPSAVFVHIIREPVACVTSMMRGMWFSEAEAKRNAKIPERRITPIGEHWNNWPRVEKCAWYYRVVNSIALRKMEKWDIRVYKTEDLTEHENVSPKEWDKYFSPTNIEKAKILERCLPVYKSITER